jgi:hypothetical protein
VTGVLFSKVVGPHLGDSIRVQYRPQEPFGDSIERFFASLHFELRGKLDEIGFQPNISDEKSG